MAIEFNHTIVAARDRAESATFFTEMFGLPPATEFGPFLAVTIDHGASLDYAQVPAGADIHPQHYAFLVSEAEFDEIYGRIQQRGLQHWADPRAERPGEINHNDGGRGVYFQDPSGHNLEIITRPYGSGGSAALVATALRDCSRGVEIELTAQTPPNSRRQYNSGETERLRHRGQRVPRPASTTRAANLRARARGSGSIPMACALSIPS